MNKQICSLSTKLQNFYSVTLRPLEDWLNLEKYPVARLVESGHSFNKTLHNTLETNILKKRVLCKLLTTMRNHYVNIQTKHYLVG